MHDLEHEDATTALLDERTTMTTESLYNARRTLGAMWGLGRPLKASELGRALRLGGRDPGNLRQKKRKPFPPQNQL